MQSEHLRPLPRNLRVATENHTDLHASDHAKPDTRHFTSLFPLEVPKAVSVDWSDAAHEEHNNDSDGPSRWEYVAALDKSTSTAQVASVASADERSIPSGAQQIAARYRAAHGGDYTPESATTKIGEKGLPQIPDDQRSMYTLATSTDTQSTMDMMWKPKPKVHMYRTDQRALVQAQSQAIAMMHNAGLKPTNKIQCRRRGCADILPDVEALKYHIHIHNIADTAARRNDASPLTVCQPSLVGCSTSNPKTLKRNHSRSKSYHGAQHSCSTVYSPPRKLSAGDLFPSLFSPRESTPEVIPNLTAVAKALGHNPSPNQRAAPLPVRNNEIPSARTSTHSRGRRTRKESQAISVGVGCNPSTAMLLSPPSPDVQAHFVLTPHTSSPMPYALDPAVDGEDDDCAFTPVENVHPVCEKLTRSRSPLRALNPIRAMNPIRNGIKRVLSIGNSPMSEL